MELRAQQVEIKLTRLELSNGLEVEEVRASTQGLNFDHHKPWADQVPALSIVALVSEQAVANLLEAKAPQMLRDFQVAFQDQKIFVRATAKILISATGTAVCRLEIRDRTQLWVVLDSIDFLGINPRHLIEAQLEKLNPVFDLASLPFAGEITSVRTEGRFIELTASGKPNASSFSESVAEG